MTTLGKAAGRHLFALSMARDDRRVESERVAKSIGHEETFASDCSSRRTATEMVRSATQWRLVCGRGLAARTFTLKVRFATFETITRSVTLAAAAGTANAIIAALDPLLGAIDTTRGMRLLGVHASHFGAAVEQLSLIDQASFTADRAVPSAHDWVDAANAIDAIREPFRGDGHWPRERSERTWIADRAQRCATMGSQS